MMAYLATVTARDLSAAIVMAFTLYAAAAGSVVAIQLLWDRRKS